jgi:hypothetical protein
VYLIELRLKLFVLLAQLCSCAQHDNRLTNVFRSTLPESTGSIAERLAGEIESAVGESTRIEMAEEIGAAVQLHQTRQDAGAVTTEELRQLVT